MLTYVTVRVRIPGWHHWPAAPDHRDYLRERHRHLFHIEASVEVHHDDRDIEFHDLRDAVAESYDFDGHEFGAASCERIATDLIDRLRSTLDLTSRGVIVSVFEDGEVGATVNDAR